MLANQVQDTSCCIVLIHQYKRFAFDPGILELNKRYAKTRLDPKQIVAQSRRLVNAQHHVDSVDLKLIEAIFRRIRVC